MRHWLAALALFAIALLSPAAGATEYDGKYKGPIVCDAIPGIVKSLRTDFLVSITDARAQYEREVFQSDQRTGIFERGSGTTSASGEIVLTGSASGTGWKFDATYRGQITGKTLRLSGTQQWTSRVIAGVHPRPCTIRLSRSD